MLPFLGNVLHLLTYSLVAILGPVGAGEEEVEADVADEDDHEFEKELEGEGGGGNKPVGGKTANTRSGAQATATYYAAVQVSGRGKEYSVKSWCRDGGCN